MADAAILDTIRELEQDLGLYQPAGDHLDTCPRCGGVSVLTHERQAGEGPYVCAQCATDLLAVADQNYRWKLWECCQIREPKPPFCMSGCTHMLKRREATHRWGCEQRRPGTLTPVEERDDAE